MVQHSTIDHTGLTGVGDVAAHEADTTSIHGIANTANLYAAGGTDVAVADGGTGASTAGAARTNLGISATNTPFTPNGSIAATDVQAAIQEVRDEAGGASLTTVNQNLAADFVSGNGSAWVDITGLTGISVVAGTWIATVDIEHVCTTNYGPVFRLWDGTTVFCQMGYIGNYLATVSTHQVMTSAPFVLGSTATMALQYFSDTVMTVTKYPIRGASATAIATHVTLLKIA